MSMLIAGDPPRLGGYWLAGRLGAGGQGVVYEAYTEDGARVAIKVLHGDEAAQLAREAATARRVASFCTARVIAVELEGDRPYIVSEYVPGPSLRKAVTDGRRFGDGDLHRLATAVATALTAIHDAGVIHRDLKPDNVLLGPDGPRVIDFGIARSAEMSLTATGLVTGTPTYMAPEVFSGQRAGTPADVFAWGGITLYAATGVDPFEAESLGGVMHRVLSANPDLGGLPEAMRPLVAAALSKEPRERPTARQLLLALVSGDGGLDTPRLLAQGRDVAHVTADAGDPALGTLAEESYALLGPGERELVAEVFLRLVTVNGRGELSVRRADPSELVAGRPPAEVAAVERIMNVFAYLLGRDDAEIWLTRPALPHAWPRMRRWVEANRDGLVAHRQILAATRRWEGSGRKDGDLFHGSSLDDALRWAATSRKNITLSPSERDFLDASARLTRRRARRTRLVSMSLAGLLVIALVAGGLAIQQSVVADTQRDRILAQFVTSESKRLAGQSEVARRTDPRLAMLLSVAAWRLDGTPEASAALTASLAQRERAMFRDPAAGGGTRRSFGPDGRTLLSVGQNQARLWDVTTGRRTALIAELGFGEDKVTTFGLSPSGRTLFAATDGRAGAWDVHTGKVLRAWAFKREPDLVRGWIDVVKKREGRTLSVRSGEQRDVTGGANLAAGRGSLSPDGAWLATDAGKTLKLTYLKEGWTEEVGEGNEGTWNHGDAKFSPDGKLLATVAPKSIQFWRLPGTQLLASVPVRGDGDLGTTPLGAFDGTTFRYLIEDQVFSINVADLTGPDKDGRIERAAFSGDGRYLLTGSTLRTVADGRTLGPVPDLDYGTDTIGFSPDGRRLAIAGKGQVRVLDTATRKVLARFPADVAGFPRFSPDGGRLAFVSGGGKDAFDDGGDVVEVWDWQARRRVWRAPAAGATEVAFSSDGSRLAVTGHDQRLFDVARGQAIGRPFGEHDADNPGVNLYFTRSAKELVVFDPLGHMTLWDTATQRVIGLPKQLAFTGDPVYSPAADLIASGGGDGRIRLIDPVTGADLGLSADPGGGLDPDNGDLLSVAFTPDGSTVLSVDRTGTVRRFPVAPSQVVKAVCARAGGSLTPEEWKSHIPALPFQKVC